MIRHTRSSATKRNMQPPVGTGRRIRPERWEVRSQVRLAVDNNVVEILSTGLQTRDFNHRRKVSIGIAGND